MTEYRVEITTKFRKDVKRAASRGYDLKLLATVVDILASGEALPIKNKDHILTGNYVGFRECHITPDWLLLYFIDNDVLVLTLTRTGSHSDLFNK